MDVWPEDREFGELDDVFSQNQGEIVDRYGLVRIHSGLAIEAFLAQSGVSGRAALLALDPAEHGRVRQAVRRSGKPEVICLPMRSDEADQAEDRLLREFGITAEELARRVRSTRERQSESPDA